LDNSAFVSLVGPWYSGTARPLWSRSRHNPTGAAPVPTPPLDRSVVRQLALFARMSDGELDDVLEISASHHYRPAENVF